MKKQKSATNRSAVKSLHAQTVLTSLTEKLCKWYSPDLMNNSSNNIRTLMAINSLKTYYTTTPTFSSATAADACCMAYYYWCI